MEIFRQVIEVASWSLVGELFRRYPGRFKVIQTHPGGGMYDCLSIYEPRVGHILDLNRNGNLHYFNRLDTGNRPAESLDIWPMMVTDSPKKVLDKICYDLGLDVPKKLPPTDATTLVPRFIAEVMKQAVFGKDEWRCEMGMCDSSFSYSVPTPSPHFEKFKNANSVIRPQGGDFPSQYDYWFICKNNCPLICVESSGLLWANYDAEAIGLLQYYKLYKRNMFKLVEQYAGQYFS